MNNAWDPLLAKRGVKPPAAAAATEVKETTEADIRKRLADEEALRVADITAACNLAGKPERAAGFIAAGRTVGQVLAALNRPKG